MFKLFNYSQGLQNNKIMSAWNSCVTQKRREPVKPGRVITSGKV